MRITEIKLINDHREAYEIIKRGKIKFDCEVSILWQNIGLIWLNPIIVTEYVHKDITHMLDDIYYNTDDINIPFRLFTLEKIEEIYNNEDIDTVLNEEFIPINGGEYYTNTISHIEYL